MVNYSVEVTGDIVICKIKENEEREDKLKETKI